MERPDGSNIVRYSPILLFSIGMYCTPSEMQAEVILTELVVKELGEPCLSTCSNEELPLKALETVSSSSVLNKKVKKFLFDTYSMRKREARHAILQPFGIPPSGFLVAGER